MTDGSRVEVSRTTALVSAAALLAIGATLTYIVVERRPAAPASAVLPSTHGESSAAASGPAPATEVSIPVTEQLADRAGIVVEPVVTGSPASTPLRLPGVVEPNAYRQVAVTPIAGGRVTRVTAELGQHVRRGQPMAQVYSPELAEAQTRLITLRAEYDAAEQQVNRTRRLVEIGAASQQELEQVHAEHAGHTAALAGQRSRLVLLGMSAAAIDGLVAGAAVTATISVPAPLDGVVTERTANVGLNVDPATPLFTIVDLSTVWVVGDLYERDFARVGVGSPAVVTTKAYPGQSREGQVSYIDPQVNPATRTARVRVEVPNPRLELRLGMLAEVEIAAGSGAPTVLVPRKAVQTVGDRHVVYVAPPGETGRYIERHVTLGEFAGDRVQVIDGLEAGETVVTEGSFYVRAEGERLGLRRGSATDDGTTTVRVTERGFEPSRVTLQSGRSRLTFLRTTDATCATEVDFPSLGIRRALPLNEAVTVDLPSQDAQEVAFACGMDMLKGVAAFSR